MSGKIGEVQSIASTFIPAGFLACDGSSYLVASYPALAARLNYAYGGSGLLFNVPDLRGRAPMGDGTGPGLSARVQGQTPGSETTSLASHTHDLAGHSHTMNHTHTLSDAGGAQLFRGGLDLVYSEGSAIGTYPTGTNNRETGNNSSDPDNYAGSPTIALAGDTDTFSGSTGGPNVADTGGTTSSPTMSIVSPFSVTKYAIRFR